MRRRWRCWETELTRPTVLSAMTGRLVPPKEKIGGDGKERGSVVGGAQWASGAHSGTGVGSTEALAVERAARAKPPSHAGQWPLAEASWRAAGRPRLTAGQAAALMAGAGAPEPLRCAAALLNGMPGAVMPSVRPRLLARTTEALARRGEWREALALARRTGAGFRMGCGLGLLTH